MKINFTQQELQRLIHEHSDTTEQLIAEQLPIAVARGHLLMEELINVAKWKWKGGRVEKLCRLNQVNHLKETTQVSFSTTNERLRIGSLMTLHGVSWPMASVILHFGFPDRYPILDVRVMRTVGGSKAYNFNNWISYTELCQNTAKRYNLSMRQLDKALWQADWEQHKKRS